MVKGKSVFLDTLSSSVSVAKDCLKWSLNVIVSLWSGSKETGVGE